MTFVSLASQSCDKVVIFTGHVIGLNNSVPKTECTCAKMASCGVCMPEESCGSLATVIKVNGNANSLLSPGFIGLLGSGLRCRVVENAGCILLQCES